MKLGRVLLVPALALLHVGVAAPSASACFSVQCITDCVTDVVDGDLEIVCRF